MAAIILSRAANSHFGADVDAFLVGDSSVAFSSLTITAEVSEGTSLIELSSTLVR
jgi:hypothetical protein